MRQTLAHGRSNGLHSDFVSLSATAVGTKTLDISPGIGRGNRPAGSQDTRARGCRYPPARQQHLPGLSGPPQQATRPAKRGEGYTVRGPGRGRTSCCTAATPSRKSPQGVPPIGTLRTTVSTGSNFPVFCSAKLTPRDLSSSVSSRRLPFHPGQHRLSSLVLLRLWEGLDGWMLETSALSTTATTIAGCK